MQIRKLGMKPSLRPRAGLDDMPKSRTSTKSMLEDCLGQYHRIGKSDGQELTGTHGRLRNLPPQAKMQKYGVRCQKTVLGSRLVRASNARDFSGLDILEDDVQQADIDSDLVMGPADAVAIALFGARINSRAINGACRRLQRKSG